LNLRLFSSQYNTKFSDRAISQSLCRSCHEWFKCRLLVNNQRHGLLGALRVSDGLLTVGDCDGGSCEQVGSDRCTRRSWDGWGLISLDISDFGRLSRRSNHRNGLLLPIHCFCLDCVHSTHHCLGCTYG
jgi:hypothetical protein